ncbi:3'(2'),5'-bisphosphate nucleotidase CysQ [Acuticoccus mangrovi]|uniref:3'(2'),5'-bisphosphate nucleotidase CysQ n=1 Tax=Acuticoccus mangrovi TaxID=2796142 RepID=A0A934IPJ7_9HYPH|nr:3'(2'),5'-bisphosphate nucleotidase CysQ [Acuticoccus mangrovi]MBJ3776228.1 3'(2'),5'-bisphosphate nucleotidase CysQ [Acuticoccus mangrovi]
MKHPSLDFLVEVAIEAGAAILPHYSPDGTAARSKDDGSPVTVADEAAEAIILKRLAEQGVTAVIAEESVAAGRIPDVADDFYLVDPLDGTKEFMTGSGEFTVNIARVKNGKPIAGVVLAPAIDTVYAGDETGAWRGKVVDGKVTEKTPIKAAVPGDALKVIASKSHLSDETKTFIEAYNVASFLSSGSSLKFCKVAEGAADLYPRHGRTMEWDTAAGHAVLLAAGGHVLTEDGAALTYGKSDHPSGTFANPYFIAAGAFDPFAKDAPFRAATPAT